MSENREPVMVFCALCPNLMYRASAKWSDWEGGYLCPECLALMRDEGYIEVTQAYNAKGEATTMDERARDTSHNAWLRAQHEREGR